MTINDQIADNSGPSLSMPPRIVHLEGGLRAVDYRAERVVVQISAKLPLLQFQTPEYSHLYQALVSLGFLPIGVEFPHPLTLEGKMAPDWQCFFHDLGFRLMEERREWSNIRTLALTEGASTVSQISSRCVTYIDLLEIRLFELSKAYNRSLQAQWMDEKKIGQLFSNSYMREIDAAIHGFAADAGSFRDLLAELTWRFVLGEAEEVTTLGTFIKRAKSNQHPLAMEIVEAARPNGWLKRFSLLRDNIIHVAPVGRSQQFHFCQTREVGSTAHKTPSLHYPILTSDGGNWDDGDVAPTMDDAELIKASIEKYSSYLDTSIDGLSYASQTLKEMTALLRKVRAATGLKGEMPHLTDADIIGEIKTFE